MSLNIQIVSIEGNIGSGKSTLLANLKTYFSNNPNVIFLKEPVDEWDKIRDENNMTILEKFYENQEKYSFSFQIMAYISRLNLLRNTLKEITLNQDNVYKTDKPIVIFTERSLFTDKMVFAKMLYDSNKIEKINYQIYLQWFHTFADDYKIHKIIYVKTDPEICQSRIIKRHRQGEDHIPLDYLVDCNKYHSNMLDKTSSECVCDNQLVLNGNVDIYDNTDELNRWIASIEEFIYYHL